MFDRYASDEKRRTWRTVLLTLGGGAIALWAISGILSIGTLTAKDIARLVPGEFGDLVPLAIVQTDACFAAAFQIDNLEERPREGDLKPALNSRGDKGIGFGEWSRNSDFSEYIEETTLRAAAYQIGLGCSPLEGGMGFNGDKPVLRIWDIARDGKQKVWHSFGEQGANPREYDDYFIGYVEDSGLVVIGRYDT